jgi:hypothetical protein
VISIGYLHCSPESFHVNLASRVQYLRWSGNEQRLAHGGARLDGCVSETDHSATTVEQPESGFSDVAARTASRSSVSTPTDATTPPMPGIIGNSVSNGPKPLARIIGLHKGDVSERHLDQRLPGTGNRVRGVGRDEHFRPTDLL